MNKKNNNILKSVLFFTIILSITFLALFVYYFVNYNKKLDIQTNDNSNLYITVEIVDKSNILDDGSYYDETRVYRAYSTNLSDCLKQHSDYYSISSSKFGDFLSGVKEDENDFIYGSDDNFWQVSYQEDDNFLTSPVGISLLNFDEYSNIFKIEYSTVMT